MNSTKYSESHLTHNDIINKPSLYEQICSKTKESLFLIQYHLLHNQFHSFWIEVSVRLVQAFQIICFSFNTRFELFWKPTSAFNILNHFFEYFHLGSFIEGKTEEYFIFFYLCIVIILTIIILESLILFKFSTKGKAFKVSTNILQKIMYGASTVFYIPIIKIFLGMLRCDLSSTPNVFYLYYGNEFQCYTGIHYFYISLSVFFLLFFIIKTLLFSSMYFETYYNKLNPNGQSTGSHEVLMKVTALIYLIYFELISACNPNRLITLILCVIIFISSFYSFYHYHTLKPHYNITLLRFNICLKLIILWCNFSLNFQRFIGYFLDCNFSVILFCLGIPLILLIIISKEQNNLAYLIFLSNRQVCSSREYSSIAMILLDQIDQIDNRSAQVVLRSYAYCIERTCTLKECPLQKYLQSMNNKEESTIFILKHIETVFQNGIKKFPYCIYLRISYCRFLIERMNKRQFAFNQFASLSSYSKSFEEEFIIFRYKKIFEETGTYSFDELRYDDNEFISLHYMNERFRKNVLQVSLLYIDFWTLLYQNHIENQQNLSCLNDIGTRIHTDVNDINNLYLKIHQVLHDDKDLIHLYYDFVSEVLHNTSKTNKMKILLDELNIQDISNSCNDIDLNNLDAQFTNKTDHYLYMLVNAQYEDIGRIENISLSLSTHFGYTKEELCGKSINLLLPNIIQKSHYGLLKHKLDLFIKNGCEMKSAKPEFTEINVYALTKAKYLIPFRFKHCLLHTENQENYWLIKVSNEHKESQNAKEFFIITDLNMIIQNFTGNSINLLGLNSFVFSTKIDITKHIKELHEELFLKLLELEDKSIEKKNDIKRMMVKTKYKTPMMITWIKKESLLSNDTNEYNETLNQKPERTETSPSNDSHIKTKSSIKTPLTSSIRDICYLSVSEISFFNQCVGFLFKIDQYSSQVGNPSLIHKQKILNMTLDPAKKSSYTNGILKHADGEKFKIDKTFLPQVSTGVNLNPLKMSYMLNNDNKMTPKSIGDYLRHEALQKFEAMHKIHKSSEGTEESENSQSSYYYTNSNENNLASIESSADDVHSNEENNKDNTVMKIQVNYLTDEYYKVDFSKIRLSVFDYKSQQYRDEKFQPISKLQEIIDIAKSEKYIHKDPSKKSDDNDNDIKPLDKSIGYYCTSGKALTIGNEVNKKAIINQIEKAILNKESLTSIRNMTLISIIVFIVVIVNQLIFLFTSLYSITTITHNNNRLKSSFDIIQVSLYAMFFTRELMLLNFDLYDVGYQPKEDYRLSIISELTNTFINMSSILDELAKTSNELSLEDYNKIYNTFFPVDIIQSDQQIFSYNLSLLSSMNKISTSIYQITQLKPENLYPLHPEFFFLTRNIINYPFTYLIQQSLIYTGIIARTVIEMTKNLIIIFSVCNICTLLFYYFINKFYDEVIQKKDSYLEVFYEIRSSDILSSLNQCVKFVQKIQNPQDFIQDSLDNSSEIESYVDESKSLVNNRNNNNKLKKQKSKGKEPHFSNTKKKLQEALIRKIHFLLILLVSIVLGSIPLILFCISIHQLKTCISIYVIENHLQTNFIVGYNILREYVFDSKSKVLGDDIEKTISIMYNKYFDTMQKLERNLSLYSTESTKKYMSTYMGVRYRSVCNYSEPFFNQFSSKDHQFNCSLLLANSGNYGISIVLSTFASQLNDIKNIFHSYLNNLGNSLTNQNLTLITLQDLTNQSNLSRNIKLMIFSNPKTMELMISLKYMIHPVFIKLKTAIEEEIIDILTFLEFIIIVLVSTFCVLEVLWFTIRWRHYISSLNKIIYKAKNMLTIIPMEILMSLSSIYKLLQIKTIGPNTPNLLMAKTIA